MATTVTLEEARSGLKTLVDRTHPSEAMPTGKRRLGGLLRGKIGISDDFDDPLPEEIERTFRGEGD